MTPVLPFCDSAADGSYQNLYVGDGAIVPTAVGANPTATTSALSEMVAQGITGIPPDADL